MAEMEIFKNKNVLITGGLGFIGSNLSIELVRLGAKVTIVDNMLPRQGGSLFNIKDIKDDVTVNVSDVRNELSMNHLVKGADYIFHLAGQVNHVDSMRNPLQDLDINCRGTLVLLEALRQFNRDAKIIFAGTRSEYGSSVKFPVDEDHPTNPKGIYAVTNLTAEKMVLVYDDVYKIKGACLRITNTFGPRHQMHHDEYGVFNWFIRKAMDNEEIPVFGDGRILRDFLYVEDLVECFLKVAATDKAYGEVFNIGTGTPVSFYELAQKIVKQPLPNLPRKGKKWSPATITPI
jgi:UDP-glucose 4-epimerase